MKSVAIGDLVLLSGVMADVRVQFPDATLVLITGEDNRALGELMLEAGDEHVVISPFRLAESIREMRAARLDVLLDFGAWVRFDAVLSAVSGAKFTVGFDTPGQQRHRAYDRAVPYSGTIHEIDNNRNLARAIGVDSASLPRIRLPDAPAGMPLDKPYVVIHPWAGGFNARAREWPDDRWTSLARELHGRGSQLVLSGGPMDVERAAALEVAMRATGAGVTNLAGRSSLRDLVSVLARADAAICVNTGIMHVAAAAGTPTIGLHGPTSPTRWRPLGPKSRAVVTRLPGCGYLNLGWEYDGQRVDCMEGIPVEDVLAAFDSLTTA